MTPFSLKTQIEKRPLLFFFLLTFLISWIGWGFQLAYALRWIAFHSVGFSILAGLGPAIAAIILTLLLSGFKGFRRLLGAFFRKGARWIWFLIALALQPLITLIALGLERIFSIETFDFADFPGAPAFFTFFAAMLIANIWEEIGWRGFALPRLQKRFSPLGASLILGVFVSLWHLPLLLNPTEEMSVIPIWAELPYSLALSMLYTWLYNKANGNLTVVTLGHAMINAVALLMMLEHPNSNTHVLINIAVTIVFAAVVASLQMSPKANMKRVTEV